MTTFSVSAFNSYPKVYNLGHPALASLLDGDVVVEEKIDGSQFSFGMFDGVLRCRSKGKEQVVGAPDKMFESAIATITNLAQKLTPEWCYRGEFLNKPKHNALAYDRVPAQNIILFDINTAAETYLAPSEKAEVAAALGLEVVPRLALAAFSIEAVKQLLNTTSCLGGQKVEGIVVKNYNRFGRDGKVLMGKYVSEAFKEVHGREWATTNPGSNDILERLQLKYTTPARWAKAVQHLAEKGQLKNEPSDIGSLIKEVQSDVVAECRAEIAEELLNWALPKVIRGVTAGLPQWYKTKLLEGAFSNS